MFRYSLTGKIAAFFLCGVIRILTLQFPIKQSIPWGHTNPCLTFWNKLATESKGWYFDVKVAMNAICRVSERFNEGLCYIRCSLSSGGALGVVLQPSLRIPVKLDDLPSYDLMRKSIWKLRNTAVSSLFPICEIFPCDGLLNGVIGCWVWRPDGVETAAAPHTHGQPAVGPSTSYTHTHIHMHVGLSWPLYAQAFRPGPSWPSSSLPHFPKHRVPCPGKCQWEARTDWASHTQSMVRQVHWPALACPQPAPFVPWSCCFPTCSSSKHLNPLFPHPSWNFP